MKTPLRTILITALLIIVGVPGCAPSGNTLNGKIVFQSDRDGNYDLFVMNPDGTEIRNLTNHTASETSPASNVGPVPSPDGGRIAFQSNRDGNNEIYVLDLNSGTQTNLTKNQANDYSPTWSPDGRQIAFLSDRDALLLDEARGLWTNNIYLMDSNGSNVRRLTQDNSTDGYGGLDWSPDGKSLALCLSSRTSYGGYFSMGIHRIDLADLSLTRLTFDLSTTQCDPRWSPDGRQILYVVSGSGFSSICRIQADGSEPVDLSMEPSNYDTSPSWSPDGRRIVFSSRREGSYHLYLMNADGSNLTPLTSGPGEETFPVWLPEP